MSDDERALRDRLTDEATTWLDDRACEYRYDYERIVDEMVDLLLEHRSAAQAEALREAADVAKAKIAAYNKLADEDKGPAICEYERMAVEWEEVELMLLGRADEVSRG